MTVAAAGGQKGRSHEEGGLVPVLDVARNVDSIVIVILVPGIFRGRVGVGSQP